MNRSSTIWVVGGNFELSSGTASTNLAVELAKGFQSRGCLPSLIGLNRQPNQPVGSSYRGIEVRLARVPLLDAINFPACSWIRAMLCLILVFGQLTRGKNRPDIILCMTMWWWAAGCIAAVCRCLGIQSLFYLVEEPSAVAKMHYQNGGASLVGYRLRVFQSKLTYRVLRLFQYVLCIVPALREKVVTTGVPARKVLYLPNVRFIPTAPACESTSLPEVTDSNDGHARFVYAGRINFTRDDFQTLLEAASLALKRGLRFKIDICGSGPQRDVHHINHLIQRNHLTGIVVWHGFVSREEHAKILNDATCFLLLKKDIDQNRFNFPTKLMDYLSEAKPVIMSEIETHQRYFKDGENCFMVPPENPHELAKSLERVCFDHDLAKRIGKQGRATLESSFSASQEVSRLLKSISPTTAV